MLTKLHTQRWEAARALFEKMKKHQIEGGIILDNDGEVVQGIIVITDNELYIEDGNCRIMYFEADPEWDHGLYTPTEEWKSKFKGWKFIPRQSYLAVDDL